MIPCKATLEVDVGTILITISQGFTKVDNVLSLSRADVIFSPSQEKNASNHLKDFPGDLFEKIQWSIIT